MLYCVGSYWLQHVSWRGSIAEGVTDVAKFRIIPDIESTGYYYVEADTEEEARKRWGLGFGDAAYVVQEIETFSSIQEV